MGQNPKEYMNFDRYKTCKGNKKGTYRMGLAATQARLLTITSRLSSVELKQQQMANMKLRLANDQEAASTKYTNALNNETLLMNDAPLTYSDLKAAGYTVVRSSDKASTASSYKTVSHTVSYMGKDESLKPSMTVSQMKNAEPKKPTQAKPTSLMPQPIQPAKTSFDFSFGDEAIESLQKANNSETWGSALGKVRTALEEMREKAVALPYNSQNALNAAMEAINAWTNIGFVYAGDTGYANSRFSTMQSYYKSAKYQLNIGIEESNKQVEDKNSGAWSAYNEQSKIYNAQQQLLTSWNNYETKHPQWEKELAQLEKGWETYNNSSVQLTRTEEEVVEVDADNDFVKMVDQNSDFLIQGLLSGYLTLMKDGKEVSLSGSKDISTVYDKSDDARAEAEYEATMNKINKKEKSIDQQMRKLETEYSALTTELNSAQSIIKDHASKDFQIFS